ncbi:hypothetical protein LRS73_02485 [Methylobacterium currus]|uniref:hypothetical protein n=1 Tax=Methylobacterium currus TaxID=2051553 RepID=UPI001E5C699C|nr:hypothetical protein [Methylobacterium currus]UHC16809.1 hypothetical protein LRS73_02485 [Methylobacterium currus]
MNEETSTDTVSAEAVRRSLDGCLRAPAFRRSQKLAAFLSYIVEEELAGRGEAIKAYSIATQALGRADSFDASNDPSVRVEAGRLRRVLDEVYAEEGRRWPVRILVPVGAYRPSFEPQAEEDPRPPETLRPASAPAPVPVSAATVTPSLGSMGAKALALFETRGQAVLALLLAVIALLLAVEIALQIYVLAHA